MSGALDGRHAIVFGGGSRAGTSNGSAASISYARRGARVTVVDLDLPAAESVVATIESEGGSGLALQADVTRADEINAAIAEAIAAQGAIDILHNNVGVVRPGGIGDLDDTTWNFVLETNLTSAFRTMKGVLPVMVSQGRGAIINVSSIAAVRYTGYDYAAYSASKAALNQLSLVTALQYARSGVRVNTIMPGLVDTALARREIVAFYDSEEEMVRERDAKVPIGRMASPWDVGNAAAFLASDDAAHITGQCLAVDGGLTVQIGK